MDADKLAALLTRWLAAGGLQPGEKFMSVREVARRYGVTVSTAHQGMRILAEKDVLEIRPRSGALVGPAVKRDATDRPAQAKLLYLVGMPQFQGPRFLHEGLVEGLLESLPETSIQLTMLPDQDPVGFLDSQCSNGDFSGIVLKMAPREVKQYFGRRGGPVVVIGHVDDDLDLPFVDDDQAGIGRLIAEHLVARGHRRVGLLMHDYWFPGDNAMLASLQQHLATSEVGAGRLEVRAIPSESSVTAANLKSLLEAPEPVTAVVCRHESVSLQCLAAAREWGLQVPGQLAIVNAGADDRELVQAAPSITSISTNGFEEGRIAGQLLKRLMAGEWPEERQIELPCELVVRQSS